jgi:hypothetical protein
MDIWNQPLKYHFPFYHECGQKADPFCLNGDGISYFEHFAIHLRSIQRQPDTRTQQPGCGVVCTKNFDVQLATTLTVSCTGPGIQRLYGGYFFHP